MAMISSDVFPHIVVTISFPTLLLPYLSPHCCHHIFPHIIVTISFPTLLLPYLSPHCCHHIFPHIVVTISFPTLLSPYISPHCCYHIFPHIVVTMTFLKLYCRVVGRNLKTRNMLGGFGVFFSISAVTICFFFVIQNQNNSN